VLRRHGAMSRMMLFTRFEAISNGDAAAARMKSTDFQPLEEVVLGEPPGFESHPSRVNGGRIAFQELSSDRIQSDVTTDSPALVFFGDSYSPGWRAIVNGMQMRILIANYNFMAVAVPAGRSHVVLEYKPQSFAIGLMCAAVGAVLLLGALIFVIARARPSSWLTAAPLIRHMPVNGRLGLGVAMCIFGLAITQIITAPDRASGATRPVKQSVRITGVDTSINGDSRFPVTNLIDGDQNSFWEVPMISGTSVNIDVRYSSQGKAVESYVFQAGPYGRDSTDRMPAEWRVEGSSDAVHWITLDRETVTKEWQERDAREYKIQHPGSYRLYRFVISRPWNGSILRLSELSLK
jgi:hypothetical protein